MNKIVQKISYFYFAFMMTELIGDFLVIVFTNQWYQFKTQYSAFASGIFVGFSNYVTMYFSVYIKMFNDLYSEVFPLLWQIDALGEKYFIRFKKLANFAKLGLLIMSFLIFAGLTTGLPWFGNNYDVLFPVKVAYDYFNNFFLNVFLIVFYSQFYHAVLTIMSNAICFTYLILHLLNQLHMLNERLRGIAIKSDENALYDIEYQNYVNRELICCIKLHQSLLEYNNRLNDLIYFPLYLYSVSGITSVLSVLLVPKDDLEMLIRTLIACVIVLCAAVILCNFGQLLENESEEIFNSAYSTPWYLFNDTNKKSLLLLLLKSKDKMVLSSSGVISLNYQLLISTISLTIFVVEKK